MLATQELEQLEASISPDCVEDVTNIKFTIEEFAQWLQPGLKRFRSHRNIGSLFEGLPHYITLSSECGFL